MLLSARRKRTKSASGETSPKETISRAERSLTRADRTRALTSSDVFRQNPVCMGAMRGPMRGPMRGAMWRLIAEPGAALSLLVATSSSAQP